MPEFADRPAWYEEYRKGCVAAVLVATELVNEGVFNGTTATVIRCVVSALTVAGVVALPNKYRRKVGR